MRGRGLLVATGLAALAVPLAPLPAGAAEATLRVEKQGWYWRHALQLNLDPEKEVEDRAGADVIPCPLPVGVSCPSVPQRPSPFEPDHLLVGRFGSLPSEQDRDQAVALFLFDLSWLEPGTEVLSATLTLEESNDDLTQLAPGQQSNPTNRGVGHPNRLPSGNVAPETAKLRACPVFEFWGATQPTLPSRWEERPPVACDKAEAPGIRKVVEAEGRFVPVWTFDLTPLAKLWAADPFGSQGLAVVPARDATGDWMVSFHGDTYVVERDLVTQQDLATTLVRRVFGTMRYRPPPGSPGSEGDRGGGGPGPEVLGSAVGSPGTAAGGLSPVNRLVNVVRGLPRVPGLVAAAVLGRASVPWYVWLAAAAGFAGLRLFSALFLPRRGGRRHRVAAAYRRLQLAGGVGGGG